MNFIKSEFISAKRLLICCNYFNKNIYYSNTRTLLTFKRETNSSHSSFSVKNQQIFGCFQTIDNKYNVLQKKFELIPNVTIVRCLAKGRDKPKEKKHKSGKPKVVLSDEEMSQLIPINELKLELDEVILRFKNDLMTHINVRSNPQNIDK